MISIPQVSSVLCGMVLLLSVSQAVAQSPKDPTHNRTIKGEVMRLEYAYYFVKEKDGREVRLHADKTTQMMGQLKQGDQVEAEVTYQKKALLMRQLP
jgi:cold shock CspA family protein